jgi:tripartite-type tricarboxylate transporter receptor subunit TctC
MPELPTIGEAGVNVPPFSFWSGLLVKSGTPAAITARLNKEFSAALQTPSVKALLAATGSIAPANYNPEELRKRINTEAASMGELAKQLNLKLE